MPVCETPDVSLQPMSERESLRTRCGRVVGRSATASALLLLSRALAQGDEKFVQLIERLDHCIGRSGAGSIERFLRRIALAQNHQRLAALLLEGHRGDRSALATFVIGPREAQEGLHFDIRAEK